MAVDTSNLPSSPSGLLDFLGISGNQAAGGALGAAGLALAERGYSALGDIGREAFQRLSTGYTDPDTGVVTPALADQLTGMTEFRPFGVTTATGSQFGMQVDPTTGQLTSTMTLSPEEQARQQRLFTASDEFLGQATGMSVPEREQAVFERMQTAMSPAQERERLALEQRLAAQGRLGVTTGMFGGTPEALTLAKAQEEARNQAMLSAMQFAGQEQNRLAGLGTGLMQAGYVPQQQLLQGITPGMTAAEQARQQQNIQAQTFGETYATGLEALLQAGLGQAGIAGGFGTQLASTALGGLFR
jgi:hypothetical protein